MTSTERAAEMAVDLAVSLIATSSTDERSYKTDRDFATTADFVIEDAVRTLLAEQTPDIGFYGEERGHTGGTDRWWCLDPIDGTTNLAHRLPLYGISLALIDNGEPVHGVIALPAYGERYTTTAGTAHLDGQPVAVAPTQTLSEAIITVGDFATGPHSAEANARRLDRLARLANTVARVRMLGSAAADLAWLAAGRTDALIMDANHPWDVAGGIALARAAGAVVTHIDGTPWTLDGPDVLAATPGIHGALVSLMSEGIRLDYHASGNAQHPG